MSGAVAAAGVELVAGAEAGVVPPTFGRSNRHMRFRRLTLERATEIAFEGLRAAGDDPWRLPEALQTLVIVTSAQGIIDNGGFQYFFEADFPGAPPYPAISAAYRRIGAEAAAHAIDDAVTTLFRFPDPHLHKAERNRVLDAQRGRAGSDLERLEASSPCGDESVWQALSAYVRANASAFRR